MLHSAPVSITHVAGVDNNIADIALQSITQLGDNHAFLMHFDNLFPLQERFWQRARAALQCDFDTSRAALDDATMDTAARTTSWCWWQQYCTNCGIDTWLHDTTPAIRSKLLLGFATRTCTGFFGKGRQVRAQTVEKVLYHVAQALALEGYPEEPAPAPTWLCPLPISLKPSRCAILPPANSR